MIGFICNYFGDRFYYLLPEDSLKSKLETTHFVFRWIGFLLILCLLFQTSGVIPAAAAGENRFAADSTNPPASPIKLIFIHHSTGENWLADDTGGLGLALSQNNYFVSDTNYGWGPNTIGDRTDIPDWMEWFRSSSTAANMTALYSESSQHAAYSRSLPNPGGANKIILFKSCFPNSALEGNPTDPPSSSGWLTVGHAKYVYNQLLIYFKAHPDKLFVVITAPPLSDSTYAANARSFNQWLVNNWLTDNAYTLKNVAVFDFYNIMTSNGGNANTNDLNLSTGNHHRWINNAEQHKTDGGSNTLAYPSGDDHPSRAGNLKATAEFLPMLNIFYNRWKSSLVPVTISGNTGVAGASLKYVNGTTKTTISDENGNYSITVPFNWSGTLTITKSGVPSFSPASRTYSNLATDRTNQNFAANSLATFVSNAAQDGDVLESAENSSSGGIANSNRNFLFVGDTAGRRQYRAILSFDTSSLPDNAKIVAVKLKLTLKAIAGTNPFSTHGSLLIDIRRPNFGTTPDISLDDFAASASVNAAGTVNKNPAGTNFTGSLNSNGFTSINQLGLTQMRLRFQIDDDNDSIADTLAFFSSNGSTEAYKPTLLIIYYIP